MFNANDIAKLSLRITLGVLILFHGVHKVIHGISGIKHMLVSSNLPEILAYGVYIGELVAPIFIILGLYARVASGILAINMLFVIYLAYGFTFSVSKYGGLALELPLVYFIMSLVVILLGSGKYAVNSK
jgi:putative oxidoreductase